MRKRKGGKITLFKIRWSLNFSIASTVNKLFRTDRGIASSVDHALRDTTIIVFGLATVWERIIMWNSISSWPSRQFVMFLVKDLWPTSIQLSIVSSQPTSKCKVQQSQCLWLDTICFGCSVSALSYSLHIFSFTTPCWLPRTKPPGNTWAGQGFPTWNICLLAITLSPEG